MNLRTTLSFLHVMKIPGLYPVMKDWKAFVRMHFLFAAYESGLLGALVIPCDREALIDKLHVKRTDLLDALLEVGLASKELSTKNGQFVLKGKRAKAILETQGDVLAAMIQANVTYYSDAYRHAADRLQGGDLGEGLDKMGDLVARFSRIAELILKNFISEIVRKKNPMRVLDVGCGSGVLLKGVYQANPDATGFGLDIDEAVVRQARENLSAWGLADRFRVHLGDIRRLPEEISGPFDLIALNNILYYFSKEDRPELVKSLHSMLSPTGVLAVAMSFRSRGKDIGSANLNMANNSLKGLTPLPDLDDIVFLLKQCGFQKVEIRRFMPGSTFLGLVARDS